MTFAYVANEWLAIKVLDTRQTTKPANSFGLGNTNGASVNDCKVV